MDPFILGFARFVLVYSMLVFLEDIMKASGYSIQDEYGEVDWSRWIFKVGLALIYSHIIIAVVYSFAGLTK